MSIGTSNFGASNSSPLSLSKSATTTCASLLRELQEIWDEIGESDTERDKILLQLEQECLDIYRKKVERSRKYIAELHQSLAAFEAEIAQLASALGERVSVPRNLRLQKVSSHISAIHELTVVMSLDFKKIMAEIHPSFVDTASGQSKSISNETLARLTSELNLLKQKKQQRLLKAEVEVERLNVLKASKMKELIFKRQSELEEIYEGVHMDVDSDKARQILSTLIQSGSVDLSDLLSSMDGQIAKAKEQAQSRKDILDKEKWRHAAEEESWLDEYERDENRYSAGRGVHKNLKRAEKARILVSKIPSLVESLTVKVKAWELERGMPFLYDKEQKKLQDQLATEQETLFGSKPNVKKPLGQSTYANTMVATPNSRRVGIPSARHGISSGKDRRDSGKAGGVIPINYVALSKDDRGS
ncbi:UNVERIFIED_CONTAM: microtubule-associated protein 5 [Sesamum radiatum]|uniref:Microtubule-associated protein 5 n=1 Tax=Sesamum radiatum TaxID=300843 RepID=A0AAW2VJT4_SESRA